MADRGYLFSFINLKSSYFHYSSVYGNEIWQDDALSERNWHIIWTFKTQDGARLLLGPINF